MHKKYENSILTKKWKNDIVFGTTNVSHFAMQFCAYLIYKQVSKPQIAAHLTVNRAKKKYYTWMAVFLV